jgi:uncharacterized protein YjbJ (UPF0337 family)
MNRDQAKGHAKDIGGKVRQKVGKLTGNRSQQAKGMANRAGGKLQKAAGDAKSVRRRSH